MDNENFPISGNELSSELTGVNKNENSQKKKLVIFSAGITFSLVIIIIIIILMTQNRDKNSKDENNSNNKDTIAEINCVYDIQSTSLETPLISEEFDKNFNFDIYINDKKIKYSKNYKFTTSGL